MKIFLSWSGHRSRDLAVALRHWLPLVLHYVEPWMSEVDIPAGNRWLPEVGGELASSDFGVLCLTTENLAAPWLLFEAGAITKSFATAAICPLLLNVEFAEVPGPLTQFQAKKANREGVRSLVTAINTRSSAAGIPDARLSELFNLAWPRLERDLRAIPPRITESSAPRGVVEVLEDLVSSNERIQLRLDRMEEHNKRLQRNIEAIFQLHPGGYVLESTDDIPYEEIRTLALEVHDRKSENIAGTVGVTADDVKHFLAGGEVNRVTALQWLRWYRKKIYDAYAEEE